MAAACHGCCSSASGTLQRCLLRSTAACHHRRRCSSRSGTLGMWMYMYMNWESACTLHPHIRDKRHCNGGIRQSSLQCQPPKNVRCCVSSQPPPAALPLADDADQRIMMQGPIMTLSHAAHTKLWCHNPHARLLSAAVRRIECSFRHGKCWMRGLAGRNLGRQ